MQELFDGLTLYHGSYCEVKQPELLQGARYKDFGQGFYLTSSREQAESFIKTSVKKAILSGKADKKQSYGFVSVFRFSTNEELNIWTCVSVYYCRKDCRISFVLERMQH